MSKMATDEQQNTVTVTGRFRFIAISNQTDEVYRLRPDEPTRVSKKFAEEFSTLVIEVDEEAE